MAAGVGPLAGQRGYMGDRRLTPSACRGKAKAALRQCFQMWQPLRLLPLLLLERLLLPPTAHTQRLPLVSPPCSLHPPLALS